jgi:hypothetical protein
MYRGAADIMILLDNSHMHSDKGPTIGGYVATFAEGPADLRRIMNLHN